MWPDVGVLLESTHIPPETPGQAEIQLDPMARHKAGYTELGATGRGGAPTVLLTLNPTGLLPAARPRACPALQPL